MEVLVCFVGGINDELQPRVPSRIDAGREDGIVPHVHLFDVAVVGDDGAAVLLSGMKLHAVGVVLLVVVAVDALTVVLEATKHVVVDDALVVVLQAALTNGERLIADKRGWNEAVAEVGVDAVFRDEDAERFVVRPLVAALCKDIYFDGIAFGFADERGPFVERRLHLVGTDHLDVACCIACNHRIGFLVELEGQRSNVQWDRYIDIVRIDLRQGVDVGKRCRHLRCACTKQQGCSQYEISVFHHTRFFLYHPSFGSRGYAGGGG